jgi:hypothetical protein
MTLVAHRSLASNPENRRFALIIVAICSFVLLLICGILWRYWFGPRQMFVAIARGDTAEAQSLLRYGVSPNTDVFLIGGLMHCAAARGKIQIMEIMYRSGADIDRIDGWGDTPAHSAVESDQLASLRWLIAHGANPSRTNRNGLTVGQCVTNKLPEAKWNEFLAAIQGQPSNSGNRKE